MSAAAFERPTQRAGTQRGEWRQHPPASAAARCGSALTWPWLTGPSRAASRASAAPSRRDRPSPRRAPGRRSAPRPARSPTAGRVRAAWPAASAARLRTPTRARRRRPLSRQAASRATRRACRSASPGARLLSQRAGDDPAREPTHERCVVAANRRARVPPRPRRAAAATAATAPPPPRALGRRRRRSRRPSTPPPLSPPPAPSPGALPPGGAAISTEREKARGQRRAPAPGLVLGAGHLQLAHGRGSTRRGLGARLALRARLRSARGRRRRAAEPTPRARARRRPHELGVRTSRRAPRRPAVRVGLAMGAAARLALDGDGSADIGVAQALEVSRRAGRGSRQRRDAVPPPCGANTWPTLRLNEAASHRGSGVEDASYGSARGSCRRLASTSVELRPRRRCRAAPALAP